MPPDVPVWNVDQAADKVGTNLRDQLQSKLDNGRGLAIYENHDLGHPQLGHAVAFTYGCPEAQFEGAPPTQCPDGLMREITGGINWRYQLVAIVPPKEADGATVS